MDRSLADVKLLVVDDHPSFLNLLGILLQEIGIKLITKASNYSDAIVQFKEYTPDVCLLDIDLSHGKKTGIDIANYIRAINQDIPIIFLTSHFQEDFYEQVRHIKPSSFMNKELSRLKLLQAIELAFLQLDNSMLAENVIELDNKGNNTNKGNPVPYFRSSQVFFKVGDAYKAIDIEKIDFFFSDNKFTHARVGHRNFPTNVQLKVLTQELKPKFLRCHKKYLINVDAIESIYTREGKIKIGKELLPIGYAYRKTFLENIFLLR